jgi:hypothetical protein
VVGELDDLTVRALGVVLIKRRDPAVVGSFEDRGPHLLGQFIAEGEPQIAPLAVIGGPVRRTGRIGPDEDSRCSSCSSGICASDRSITVR